MHPRSPYGRLVYSQMRLLLRHLSSSSLRSSEQACTERMRSEPSVPTQSGRPAVYPSKTCLLSRDRDSNPGPAVYKTAALPLSYLGKLSFTGSRTSRPNSIKLGKFVLGQNSCSTAELRRQSTVILSKMKYKEQPYRVSRKEDEYLINNFCL